MGFGRSATYVSVGNLHCRLQKAKLKPEALEGLHLPLRVRDGFIEELEIHLPDPLSHVPMFEFRMQNLLLLLAPGPGLAEAGGLAAKGCAVPEQRSVCL